MLTFGSFERRYRCAIYCCTAGVSKPGQTVATNAMGPPSRLLARTPVGDLETFVDALLTA